MEGVERAYYPSGKLEFEVTNKNDLRNGIERHYSEEGKLIIEVPYQNDVVTGLVKQYNKKESQSMKQIMLMIKEKDFLKNIIQVENY